MDYLKGGPRYEKEGLPTAFTINFTTPRWLLKIKRRMEKRKTSKYWGGDTSAGVVGM